MIELKGVEPSYLHFANLDVHEKKIASTGSYAARSARELRFGEERDIALRSAIKKPEVNISPLEKVLTCRTQMTLEFRKRGSLKKSMIFHHPALFPGTAN